MKLDKSVLEFLSDLEANNNREWFNENKKRYEQARDKFLDFTENVINGISMFDDSVKNLSAKDTLFRIYRDVRFGKDKSPYKTHFGAYISKGGRKSIYGGYYLHIQPGGESLIAGGIHCPESSNLKKLRTEIMYRPEIFKKIIYSKEIVDTFGELYEDKLKSAPRGFDKNFEDIELLKYKEYTLLKKIEDKEVLNADFYNNLLGNFKKLEPLNSFLNDALFE